MSYLINLRKDKFDSVRSPPYNAKRESLKNAKTPSMYGYFKLHVGHPTKTIDPSPPSAHTALTPAMGEMRGLPLCSWTMTENEPTRPC